MKIRKGFVSNSSSSSFVITGKEYSTSKFEELLSEHLTDEEFTEYENDPGWFPETDTFKKLFPGLYMIIDHEAGYAYIGEQPAKVPEETKKRIADIIKKIDPKVTSKDIVFHNEVMYC